MKRNGRYLRLMNNWIKAKQYNSMIIWNIAQDNSVSSICINSKYETAGHGVFWRLPDMEYFENDLSGR